MIRNEDTFILAGALQHPEVFEALRPALTDPFVVANGYTRRIMELAAEYSDAHGQLPSDGAWTNIIGRLDENSRMAIREFVGRYRRADLDGHPPSEIIARGRQVLRTAASAVLQSRLGTVADEDGIPDPDAAEKILDRYASALRQLEPEWPDPLPLGQATLPELPAKVLPPWLRDFVVSVAESTQTPVALPLLLGLSAVSVAVANKLRLHLKLDWQEPTVLWAAIAMPPASRKSPVFKLLISPVHQYEAELERRARPLRDARKDQQDVLKKALQKAKKEAADAVGTPGEADAVARVEAVRDRLSKHHVPPIPRLAVSDVTAERLAQIMADNSGRIGVLAPEGDIFKILAGLYSGEAAFGLYKLAWTGDEAFRDDRISREGTVVRRPALTFGVTFQPVVVEQLARRKEFRGEGLLGRFLWALPHTNVGHRATGDDAPQLDREATREYGRVLRDLLKTPPAAEKNGEFVPHELPLGREARGVFNAFWAEVEGELRSDGQLAGIGDWGGKLVGQTARIAALLHVAARAGRGQDPFGAPVAGEAMQGAVTLARALIPHALAVFAKLEAHPDLELARYVLDRLLETGAETVSELQQRTRDKGGIHRPRDLKRLLHLLEEHAYLRLEARASTGGRPPSPRIRINPKLQAAESAAVNPEMSSSGDHAPQENSRGPSRAPPEIPGGLNLDAVRQRLKAAEDARQRGEVA